MSKDILGSIYTNDSEDFNRGLLPIARCIKAMNHDLGVVEMGVKRFGNLSDTKTQSRTVYDSAGISPTLCSGMDHGNTMPHICEQSIVAMRGRNPENPSDRTVGAPTEQRLEPNSQGICNTLTSVQKDNMVLETVRIKQANKQGYIDCEVGGVADFSYPSSTTRRGRVQDRGNTCPAITVEGAEQICRVESQYRIRKLTPLECWRLMAFTDEDFHNAEAVNSNTQLYKQAGNSIVVSVLEAIFRQMHIQNIPSWNEEKGA